MSPTIPTRELGTPGGVEEIMSRPGAPKRHRVESMEQNSELRFPESVPVYDRMRSEDGHVGSVLSAITLAVTKADWNLEGDASPEVMDLVRRSLSLPGPGEPRLHGGVSLKNHIAEAAETQLWAGFMCFEQVYEVDEDTGLVYLKKLAPRPPRTIADIEVARDGGLRAVHQVRDGLSDPVRIGVDRLVMYTHRKEGAEWSGRSILRTAYKHWLIKDILIRLDAQAAERNSMGIPAVQYDAETGSYDRALEIARNMRAGESAGVAYPSNVNVQILGVSGSTVDLIPRVRYHDQEIARSSLAMFLDVSGNENGSRAMVEPILDVFMDSVQAFADSIAETATEHIIRDLVRYNFGADVAYPVLTPGDLKASQGISVEALRSLIGANVIRPDDRLENQQRERYGLPEADQESTRQPDGPEQVGSYVRAGFTPESAAQVAGIEGLEHTGLLPVTVQAPADPGGEQQDPGQAPGQDEEQDEGQGLGETRPLPGLTDLIEKLSAAQEVRTKWYESRLGDQ